MQTITTTTNYPGSRPHDGYEAFSQALVDRFDYVTMGGAPLFTTNVEGLFDAFLNNLPPEARQHYTCSACRHFVNRYGGLVYIDDSGVAHPAIWDLHSIPEFFRPAVASITNILGYARVNGVFLTNDSVLGTPVTGEWHHLHVMVRQPYRSALLSAGQAMAEKREDFKMLTAALKEYHPAAIDIALKLLRSDALYRSEKVLGVAEWFRELSDKRPVPPHSQRYQWLNLRWKAVATAPAGFCHVKSSMIGTLLDDIVAGLSFETVSTKFAAKMNPLQYQRPQVAPKAGNIAKAEEVVAKLGIEGSLARRYARLDEIDALWRPVVLAPPRPSGGGVFGHLKPKGVPDVADLETTPQTITWDKFARTVLPHAESIELMVKRRDDFCALLTAVDPDAPPIIQWDGRERRNPFSWYLYSGGSLAENWELKTGWNKVTAVAVAPSQWGGGVSNQGNAAILILDGARDSQHRNCSSCLFPEVLKSELHQIRATIEAYSKTRPPSGYTESSACGLWLQGGKTWNTQLRVKTSLGYVQYRLDRWD